VTLILTCLTNEFVVQASDRRVTPISGGQAFEDEANKAIFYGDHFVWAYTGLAQLGLKNTDEWMFDLFPEADDLASAIDAMKALAPAAIQVAVRASSTSSKHFRTNGRLAFVGAGFADHGAGIVPLMCLVTNFHDPEGRPTSEASAAFTTIGTSLPADKTLNLIHTGAHVPSDVSSALADRLLAAVPQGAHAVSHQMSSCIREVAQTDASVGNNVMACVVLRVALESGFIGVQGPPVLTVGGALAEHGFFPPMPGAKTHCYYYWPESESPDDFVYCSPPWVSSQACMASMVVGRGTALERFLERGPFPKYFDDLPQPPAPGPC
jgi:hypothetical protein